MRIQKIEFENFRNFRDRGEIRCATDGKVTIIYGKNGDGKTTLHQLLQWVFYGEVHFNKTTTDHLYNLGYERDLSFGDTFKVMGRIDFEHEDINYSLSRTYTYKKDALVSRKVSEELSLNQKSEDNDWRRVDSPQELIEKMLPSGLSEYFFFDGESMIADLRVKGRDSAGKLKNALYSMFDLDVLESALEHLGRTDLKTTVLGKLYLSKGTITSGSEISTLKTNIENIQAKKDSLEKDIEEKREKKAKNQKTIREISERIGNTKSKAEYEAQRNQYINSRDALLNNYSVQQEEFGKAMMDMFPSLFISKAVRDAKGKIKLKVEQAELPNGLGKDLISYLLEDTTVECICGGHLGDAQKRRIKAYLELLPPLSFTSMYDNFSRTADRWSKGYNKKQIEEIIKRALDSKDQANTFDKQIKLLDEEEKAHPDIEDLVVARQEAENEINDLDDVINELSTEAQKCKILLNKRMQEFDEVTATLSSNEKVQRQIDIMQLVAEYFRTKLEDESVNYSKRLESNIQQLLDSMLTSKRKVTVSPEFSVMVTDSFDDESKSEGQFAVVSFAYIGGILKMLKSEETLSSKEYPLVLDGPFSKLDPDQRQNVVDSIPTFAPQVILFSKDDLQDVFSADAIGMVWTIESNEEKNEAVIKEGYLWK